jgi:hypothetical protein
MNYDQLASSETVAKTSDALAKNHFKPLIVDTKEEALAKVKELIPAGASVMNGASRTLEEIGYVDYLKEGNHGWDNLHANILEETDDTRKADLRKMAVLSDYYLGSVHAVTEDGQLVISSNSGSQLPHLAYTSPNLVLVVSTQKITPDLMAALGRIQTQVIPLEDERMKSVYGFGTLQAKTLILHQENPALGRSVYVILVNEKLGF